MENRLSVKKNVVLAGENTVCGAKKQVRAAKKTVPPA